MSKKIISIQIVLILVLLASAGIFYAVDQFVNSKVNLLPDSSLKVFIPDYGDVFPR